MVEKGKKGRKAREWAQPPGRRSRRGLVFLGWMDGWMGGDDGGGGGKAQGRGELGVDMARARAAPVFLSLTDKPHPWPLSKRKRKSGSVHAE